MSRISLIINLAKERLGNSDPNFVQVVALDTINTLARQASGEIDGFVSSQNVAHVASANIHADSILTQLASLFAARDNPEVVQIAVAAKSFHDSCESYRKKASESLGSLQSRVQNSEGTLAKLERQIEDARSNIGTALTEYQSQFSTAQETRSQAFADAQSAHRNSHNELINNHNVTLISQERETTRLLGEKEKDHQGRLDELNVDFSARAQEILTEIEKKKGEVEKLLGVIGTLGVSSGYKKAADENRATAVRWQFATVASIVLLVICTLVAFWPSSTQDIRWESLIARFVLTISFGVLAAYCGFQGDRSQHAERRNRKIALEFEALGAYLDPLPPEQQHEFRLKLAELSFGKDDPKFTKDDRSPASLWDLIAKNPEMAQSILNTISNIKNPPK